MAKIGDKYIIEIGGVYSPWSSCKEEFTEDHNRTIYRVKGFRDILIDEEGLSKLEKYEEPKDE